MTRTYYINNLFIYLFEILNYLYFEIIKLFVITNM